MKSGEIYRGLLLSAEDTMNVSLSEVIRTARNGKISKLPNVYLRGSGVRFIALPDLLKNAPCFQKVQAMKRKMEETQAQREGTGEPQGCWCGCFSPSCCNCSNILSLFKFIRRVSEKKADRLGGVNNYK